MDFPVQPARQSRGLGAVTLRPMSRMPKSRSGLRHCQPRDKGRRPRKRDLPGVTTHVRTAAVSARRKLPGGGGGGGGAFAPFEGVVEAIAVRTRDLLADALLDRDSDRVVGAARKQRGFDHLDRGLAILAADVGPLAQLN